MLIAIILILININIVYGKKYWHVLSDQVMELMINITDMKIKPNTKFHHNYKPIIPLNIHQIWAEKIITMPLMNKTVTKLISDHPKFTYNLYDDNDCRNLIINNFDSKTLYSFDHLIPGAYKADLCRYCILYTHGGIYLDIKMTTLGDFNLMSLTDKEYYVLDRYGMPYEDYTVDIFNAVMVNKPKSPVLKRAIDIVNKHVEEKFYGTNFLYPTGPTVLGEALIGSKEDVKANISHALSIIRNLDLVNKEYKLSDDRRNRTTIVQYHNTTILDTYPGYRQEQHDFYRQKDKSHYSILWKKREIYLE